MGAVGKENDADVDPMAVRWGERHDQTLERIWSVIPNFLRSILVTFAVFAMGVSFTGEWIIVLVHMLKQWGWIPRTDTRQQLSWENFTFDPAYFKNLQSFMIWSTIAGYTVYFSVGGFIHWYFYVRQRNTPEKWKCQPKKFMDAELEKHEIIFGSTTLFFNTVVSATLACYISNGGFSTIYYDFGEKGWLWLILQVPVVFIYQDYCAYWMHRIYHLPFLYKYFHKMHHKYKQPTAFSVTALHPVEAVSMQLVMVLPLFVFPVHWLPFYTIVFYSYYHGIIDHSGVNFKAHWWQPWQPDAIFHDNHHQYFHVNFGFNISYWDKLHGTDRKKDRIYTEDIFYGVGKNLNEATESEIKDDLQERLSENPLAYRSKKLDFLEGMPRLDNAENQT